jgi:hypothetical protein
MDRDLMVKNYEEFLISQIQNVISIVMKLNKETENFNLIKILFLPRSIENDGVQDNGIVSDK